nr:NAD-dependent epimerase/dehydratase family protein [Rhodoferax sp. AJA081-3]
MAVGNVDGETDWAAALTGCDVVIHLAARVHIMNDKSKDPLAEFRRVNTLGTTRLAEAAMAAGVRRLVNVSSIGVNGPSTEGELKFTDLDTPDPHNPYPFPNGRPSRLCVRSVPVDGLRLSPCGRP